jgi:hypothetical protein
MTFETLALPPWFVLEISLRALAAAAAVAAVLRLLRMRAAAVLHSAWSAVLVAMLLMPVLPSIVPALPLAIPANAGGLLGAPVRTEDASPDAVGYPRPDPNALSTAPSLRMGNSQQSAERLPASATYARSSRSWLPLVLLGAYAAGVLLFVVRLLYGWSLASGMIRRAKRGGPIRVDVTEHIYESTEVTVPMTVGVIRPVIVVPVTWNTWDSDTLAAILAHEVSHVRRHDAAINFVARINRAIFWFHPLAWWLERKLAVTAEHACDEAAARAIAAPDRYAEILLDMADVVHRNRGRLTWQSVGMNGAGLLNSRIDRLLRGDAFASASSGRKIAAGIGCVLAIAAAVACRQQSAPTPLREDPELAKRLAQGPANTKKFEAARDMTPEQADALEQRVAVNPQDFDARLQLVTYYRTSSRVTWDKKVPGLRRHALWLIEHHPDHDVGPPALSPDYDPAGFAAAKTLWEAHLARPDASPFIVYRAASFFAPHDKPYAEQLILRGMTMDPDSAALTARFGPGVGAYEWPIQLSSLYGAALRGSESVWGTYNDLRTHADKVNSQYAMEVRRTLEATTDARLLARVGTNLTQAGPSRDPAVKDAVDQVRALGIRYLERALELDPNLVGAKATLVRIRLPERINDADRLASRAHMDYMRAEGTEYYQKDMGAAKRQRDEARTRAEEVLKMAVPHAGDPAYSAAVMTAHQVLATVALRDGDRERAVQHMRDSVNVPTSEQIQYVAPLSWMRPVNRLLKHGERETVVEFLEAFARLTITERDRVLQDAQAIREGRMPSSYQSMIASERQ